MSAYVPPARLATEADLNRAWVNKAAELGLVNLSTLDGEDLIVVRVFAFVDQLVWPGERRSRAISRNLEPWQRQAVNAARDSARDEFTKLDSVLWVTPKGAVVTHAPVEHAAFVLNARPDRSIFAGIPIGKWIAELPPGLETIFHWPSQLPIGPLPLSDGTGLHLTAFSTVHDQITVFVAGHRVPLQASTHTALRKHVATRHPGGHVRVIERPLERGSAAHTHWFELYERPDGTLVRRPLALRELLDDYGPQLNHIVQSQDSTASRRRSKK
ncbi:hypothetical protein OTB20_39355 [Streptomyces sp. H27-H1]|uniref:hypothetical protein n=1 Tax=Streptomyces sp. H27-H1 TaxID=2996461 RepID=UPI00226ECFA1|nr:hypothetical protein [Streptomyces sp. H27-H1]MCY0932125.1 hypothetical protein [Streptomyces sp. H27-H1]